MVYESDFYTTRRPYSYTRPTISSYSVTRKGKRAEFDDFDEIEEEARERAAIRVTSNKLKRLRQKIREGIVEAEAVRRPPRQLVQTTVKHENKIPETQYRCFTEFEDDIRSIRTATSRVNRAVTPLPRGRRAVSCAPLSRYDSSITTDSDFLEHLRGVSRSVKDDIFTLSRYAEPARRYVDERPKIWYPYYDKYGKSHLASVRICGDKAYPIRKPAFYDDLYTPDYPSVNRKVRNEVEYLSHYLKNRRAANEPVPKIAGWKTVSKWCDIARKHRFGHSEFYNLVRILDKKVRGEIETYNTETKMVDGAAKEDENELRKFYDSQWEGSDSYLEALKRQRKRKPLKTLQKFDAFEEEEKYIDPTLVG